ncbi:MAG: hypothetical protein A2017_03390 [Lentisphaerae bacterium GWF2_44_16]|nr:MAG: hypothetical protein A2017_03390 [Lentisphaerae bacterium GWF2_44_16]
MNKIIFEVYNSLLREISSGRIKAGALLPKETELAEQFKTNRMNAHRAVKELEKNGLISRKKHSGTFLKKNIDRRELEKLVKASNRSVCVLYSITPHYIHWNETSFKSLESQLASSGYSVTYKNIPSKGTRKNYISLLNEISENGASALVIFPDMEDTDFLRNNSDLLLDFEMPIFMLNRSGEPLPFDMVSFVSMDPFGDGIALGRFLKMNRCRNIIMINENSGKTFWGIKRYEGLELGLRQGNDTPGMLLENVKATPEKMSETIIRIKNSGKDTVVVAVNNAFAAKFIDAAKKEGLKIPEDYRLIAFDDNPMYRSYNLTSMAAPMKEFGEVFGRMISEESWINSFKGKVSVKLPGHLIIRDTFQLIS